MKLGVSLCKSDSTCFVPVDANAAKGKQAIEWVVNTVKDEARSVNISGILDKISSEVQDLKNTVSDSLINTAVSAIKDLKTIQPPIPIAVVQVCPLTRDFFAISR